MNALKFQQDILTAYMRQPDSAQAACWARQNESRVALFLNSHVGAILSEDEMVLNLAKITELPNNKIFEGARRAWEEGNRLTPTDEYRISSGNKRTRIYQARAWRTGIDQGLLKYFDLATMRLYQLKDRDAILVTETTKGFEESVGIVMPCKI